jgi:2-dehydro-3-deoxygluconokinase
MSVLTVGETMALLDPVDDGEIEVGVRFTLRIAGAESNFGIALARLGVPVTWVSRVGADPFGDVVVGTLAEEGLDVRYVKRDPAAPTGVFFKQRSGGKSRVLYYRKGSAATRLAPGDVPGAALDNAALVHLTGITMALSDTARTLVVETAQRAHERGVTVVFDPNWRPALWESPAEASTAHAAVLPYVDWYLCGLDEGNVLFETESADELVAAVHGAGAGDAAVRVGARGALVREGSLLHEVPPARVEAVRDEIGAGDGFAAGFAYGLLHGWRAVHCAHAGNVVAAAALAGTGDWETFPRLEDVAGDLLPRSP